MKKIALVNQRYGLEVNGGSEYYTRLIAEKLKEDYEVEILTSKALSYEKWEDYYTQDVETINGVTVRRFSVAHTRRDLLMKILSRLIARFHMNFKWLCDIWVRQQGPYLPKLTEYIRMHKQEYAAIVFVTYLYYPTVVGMKEAKEKAVFIPTAHDEPYLYFKSHRPLFRMPKAIIYLTEEEKMLVNRVFHNETIPSAIAGVGVDLPDEIDNDRFRKKYQIEGDYLIYTGRVDKSKGCDEMLDVFLTYLGDIKEDEKKPTLVLMGQEFMKIPEHPNIRYLGFVPEQDKFDGVSGARALWLPSQFESLSISVLEAMTLSIPVIVNGKCEVLKGHVEKSGGGMFYQNSKACQSVLETILGDQVKRDEMGRLAKKYVDAYYSWPVVMGRIREMLAIAQAD